MVSEFLLLSVSIHPHAFSYCDIRVVAPNADYFASLLQRRALRSHGRHCPSQRKHPIQSLNTWPIETSI
jgi:hypothetical protein